MNIGKWIVGGLFWLSSAGFAGGIIATRAGLLPENNFFNLDYLDCTPTESLGAAELLSDNPIETCGDAVQAVVIGQYGYFLAALIILLAVVKLFVREGKGTSTGAH